MLLESKLPGPTVRAARWSALHPWRAIFGWFVFVVICLGAGSALGTHQATSADYRIGEAGRAEAIAAQGGLERRPVEYVLIDGRGAKESAARDAARRMRALPEVAQVAEPARSSDGRSVMVAVTMRGEELTADAHLGALRKQTAAVQAAHPDVRVAETGQPSVGQGVDAQRDKDLGLSEMITLPVTLLTLLIAFGSLLAAGVPVLLALSSIAAAMGLAGVASHLLPDAGVGKNLILLIGMAVGVDYSLFYLKRDREERARGTADPVGVAAATAGRAIVVSGFAVIASTACLYLATDVIFSSLATGTILVVAVAMVSSLTVLPALLAKLGGRRRARSRRGNGTGRVWGTLLRPAQRHPLITAVASAGVLVALALPALSLKLGVQGIDTHPRKVQAVRDYDRLTAAFPSERVRHQIAVRADASAAGQVGQAMRELATRTRSDPAFTKDVRLRTSPDHRITVLEVGVPFKSSSPEAAGSLHRLRDSYLPATVEKVPGAEVAVTGDVARDADYMTHQNEKLPLVVGALLLVTYVMTVWAFRSVVMGLVGIVLNLLSAAASFGLLVLVFQHRWAEGLLHFTSTGDIGARVPLFLFVILFGLSMDYQVFVVSRIREAVQRGVPTRQAVAEGISGSAGVVTSAAVVMTTVFASFVFLSLIEMKEIGFVLAAAVLLDAFIVRILLLPSVMTLLGERCWWPSRPAPDVAPNVPTAPAMPVATGR